MQAQPKLQFCILISPIRARAMEFRHLYTTRIDEETQPVDNLASYKHLPEPVKDCHCLLVASPNDSEIHSDVSFLLKPYFEREVITCVEHSGPHRIPYLTRNKDLTEENANTISEFLKQAHSRIVAVDPGMKKSHL